jgi:hypothetical protein
MVSDFEKALVQTSTGEYADFHGYDENDPPLAKRIETYWTSVGTKFPGVSTPWSAVFVSWCMKTAGTTKKEFLFAAAHAKFVNWAISNAETQTGLFRAYPITECAPTLGDLIQNNRAGNKFSYDYAASHDSYPSHSAIVVALGQDGQGRFATTIGGNEGAPGSVGRKRVSLDEDGMIIQRAGSPYICVVQCLK